MVYSFNNLVLFVPFNALPFHCLRLDFVDGSLATQTGGVMDLMNMNEAARRSRELSWEGVALRAGLRTPCISHTGEPSRPSLSGRHPAIERATSCFGDPGEQRAESAEAPCR